MVRAYIDELNLGNMPMVPSQIVTDTVDGQTVERGPIKAILGIFLLRRIYSQNGANGESEN